MMFTRRSMMKGLAGFGALPCCFAHRAFAAQWRRKPRRSTKGANPVRLGAKAIRLTSVVPGASALTLPDVARPPVANDFAVEVKTRGA